MAEAVEAEAAKEAIRRITRLSTTIRGPGETTSMARSRSLPPETQRARDPEAEEAEAAAAEAVATEAVEAGTIEAVAEVEAEAEAEVIETATTTKTNEVDRITESEGTTRPHLTARKAIKRNRINQHLSKTQTDSGISLK